MLPNFIHVGAAKCASSWLWRVYQEHPDVYVPVHLDNVNFFVADYHKGLDWYQKSYFGDWCGEKAVGEMSNSYMVFEPAIARIVRDLPGVKLTATVRNPIDRAFLSWVHMNKRRFQPDQRMEFERVLDPHGHGLFRLWVMPSLYSLYFERLFQYVSRERLRIMFYEDLVADPADFLRDLFEYLEVDSNFQPSILYQRVNKVTHFPTPEAPQPEDQIIAEGISEEVRESLRKIFQEDIEALQEITGRDLSHWQ